jgi:hypothetical protein
MAFESYPFSHFWNPLFQVIEIWWLQSDSEIENWKLVYHRKTLLIRPRVGGCSSITLAMLDNHNPLQTDAAEKRDYFRMIFSPRSRHCRSNRSMTVVFSDVDSFYILRLNPAQSDCDLKPSHVVRMAWLHFAILVLSNLLVKSAFMNGLLLSRFYLNPVHDYRDVNPVHFVGAAWQHFIFSLPLNISVNGTLPMQITCIDYNWAGP